jgi:hypothetical protein
VFVALPTALLVIGDSAFDTDVLIGNVIVIAGIVLADD